MTKCQKYCHFRPRGAASSNVWKRSLKESAENEGWGPKIESWILSSSLPSLSWSQVQARWWWHPRPGPTSSGQSWKRFFVVVRWGEMFSYSANRIRTTKSKTQSWITKKMSRIANVTFIVLQMYNHDCHILLIASRGALRYVQRHLSWTLITCVNMVRFMKS